MRTKATSLAVLLLAGLMLYGCGGREARPVAKTTSFDEKLSCGHIAAQLEVNETRLEALGLEARRVSDANALRVIFISPFYLDLSGAERKEIDALQERNIVLQELAEEKDCTWLAEREAAAAETQALEAAAQENAVQDSNEETTDATE